MSTYNLWIPVVEKMLASLPDRPVDPSDAFVALIEAQGDLETIDCTIDHFEHSSSEKLSASEISVLRGNRKDMALKTAVRALVLFQALAEQETLQ